MLFYRTAHTYRQEGHAAVPMAPTRIPPNAITDYPMRAPWMLKCLVVGMALLVLAYWLVQIAGAQYLATLTSATLLSFLLVYIVWCLTVKRRQAPQHTESVASSEPPVLPTTSSASPPSNLHPALKHYGVAPRECSPPPSYDEVLRQMGAAAAAAAAASTSGASPSTRCDLEAPPEDFEAPSSSALPVCTIESAEETQIAVPNSIEMASSAQQSAPNDVCVASTSSAAAEHISVASTPSTSAMAAGNPSEILTEPTPNTTTTLSVSGKRRTETTASSEPTPAVPTSMEPMPMVTTPVEPSSVEPTLVEPTPMPTPTPTTETVGEVEFQPTPAEVAAGDASTAGTSTGVSIEIA